MCHLTSQAISAATMRHVVVLLAAMPCASCDIFYGVFHSARDVSPIPSDSCVVNAIGAIPGITNVSSGVEAGGRPLTLHGVEKPDEIRPAIERAMKSGKPALVNVCTDPDAQATTDMGFSGY